jgi:glycosyltransferase involved in cell wall biosynthesis
MAAGVPALATAVGGIPEALRDGVNGFLVVRHVAALADRIRELAEDRPLHRRLREGARKVFRERFLVDIAASRYRELYETALI